MKQGILEEVKEHTDWVNSYIIVEKDTGNHHSPNHTVKKKLRICLDPRELNESLEREPHHTCSTEEITAKFQSRDRMENARDFPTSMEMCMDDHLTLTTEKTQQKQFQGKASEQCCSTHSISPDSQKNTVLSHAEFPLSMESTSLFPGNQFPQGKEKSTSGTKLKPIMDTHTFTLTFTLGTDQQQFVDTDQKPFKPFTNSYKKHNGMTAMIGITPMTAMIAIALIATLRRVNMITTCILMSVQPQDSFSNKLDQLRKSTVQDNQLTRLSHYINTGFPCDKKNLPTDLHEFWNHREALSIESRLITCGNRIIVPKEMRPEMLQYIHEGHQGKERCLLWARNTVFWPKMMYDVQELIERCIICQEHGGSQPIIGTTQELPPFPWHTLATDIFYWKRIDFLIVADVFSKYFLVRKLANSISAAICAELATIVTELSLPHIIRSDNGPCYNSKEFQQFLQHYNITHHTSSPHHPRTYGFVDRVVRVAKKLMDKAGKEGKPWISGLYEYRVTPQSGSIASPLQLIT